MSYLMNIKQQNRLTLYFCPPWLKIGWRLKHHRRPAGSSGASNQSTSLFLLFIGTDWCR